MPKCETAAHRPTHIHRHVHLLLPEPLILFLILTEQHCPGSQWKINIFWKDLENNGARRPGEGGADGKADVCRHAYMGSECRGLKGRKSVQCEQHCEQVTEQTLFAPPWALTGWESPGTFPLMHYCNGKTLHVRKLIWVWQTSIGQHFLRLTKTIHSWFTSQLLCNIRFPNFHVTVSLSLSFALQFVMGYSSLKLDRCLIFPLGRINVFP